MSLLYTLHEDNKTLNNTHGKLHDTVLQKVTEENLVLCEIL